MCAHFAAPPAEKSLNAAGVPTFALRELTASVFRPRNDDCFIAVLSLQRFASFFYET
jgi:hypothetical protein